MNIPKDVRPGDAIEAKLFNSVLGILRRALRIRPAQGLGASWTDAGLAIWLSDKNHEWVVPARILDRTGADPDLPANIRYTVGALGQYTREPDGSFTGFVIRDALPVFGRPVKGAEAQLHKIRPANVGAMCWILRDRDNEGNVIGKIALMPGGSDGETSFMQPCPNP